MTLVRSRKLLATLLVPLLGALLVGGYAARLAWKKGVDHLVTLIPAASRPCPDPRAVHAFLVLGQSHGANTGEARMKAVSDQAYSFLDGQCWHLQDPVKGPPENGGSIWPAFADSYARPVLIADMAISGSSIRQWTAPEQIAKVRATIAALRKAGYEPTIFWLNGETDAADAMSADSYLEQLDRLAAAFPDMHWLITQESRCYDKQSRYLPLEEARARFVAADPARRGIAADLDAISVDLRQGDHCHLNRRGQQVFGAALARSVGAPWPR
jgi:hypothetical protein